jgi:hypothetical protein
MPESSRELAPLGWLKWLWRSSIGTGVLFFVLAAVSGDYFFALAAVGMIVTGLADYVDRRNRRLRRTLVGAGFILVAAGIYLSIKNYQLSDFLFKP